VSLRCCISVVSKTLHKTLMPNAWHCADCHRIARFRAETTYLEGKPHRGTLHQRMVEDIPLGPINIPVLIAQGTADKIVTATSADGIRDVATHTYRQAV
jgi:hypothetical protein